VRMRTVLMVMACALVGACSKDKKEDYSVPGLIETLKHKDPNMRYHAAKSLGKLGAQAKEAVPALVEALRDSDKMVRMGAAYALAGIGPTAAPALPALKESIKDPEKEVREAAAYALKQIQARK
jgi:HEAT repeat protein